MTGNEHEDQAVRPSTENGWIAGTPPGGGGESPRSVPPLHTGDRSAIGEGPSLRSRWTLAIAVMTSVLLLGATVLWWQNLDPAASDPPPLALPGPWEPQTVPAGDEASAPVPESPPTSARTSAPAKEGGTGRPTTRPPATTPPTRPTTRPPVGPNLSVDADADGSSRAEGTRFGNVRDGDPTTFWSPTGSTGSVSIKRDSAFTVDRINIREAAGGGRIGSWRVTNFETGAALATGTGAGAITFSPTTLRKITFEILGASGTPRVAEFETFAG